MLDQTLKDEIMKTIISCSRPPYPGPTHTYLDWLCHAVAFGHVTIETNSYGQMTLTPQELKEACPNLHNDTMHDVMGGVYEEHWGGKITDPSIIEKLLKL
jgi:hypothetical protein